jgi:solute:Na+ symporter, SSS family
VPLYRNFGSPSAYAYLEHRFGPWARIYASASYLLTQVMRIGTILYLLALPLSVLFNWPLAPVIAGTGLAVLLYSAMGGIRAVIWTDALQGLLLIGGALACLVYLLTALPGGVARGLEAAFAQGKFSLGSTGLSLRESTVWVVLAYGLFINLQNFGIDQNFVQRYMASGSDRQARVATLLGSWLYLPVSFVFFAIGTALYLYYSARSGALPAGLQAAEMGDRVFPYFIATALPPGLGGLLIAAIFAAGMSTVSTSINSSATVILTDYIRRFGGGNVAERTSMRWLYAASALIGIGGIGVGFAFIRVEDALDAWWKLASVFSGGMLGLFLLGAFSKTIHVGGALAGVLLAFALNLWMSLSPLLPQGAVPPGWVSPFHTYLSIVFGTLAIFLAGFLAVVLRR